MKEIKFCPFCGTKDIKTGYLINKCNKCNMMFDLCKVSKVRVAKYKDLKKYV